ncbi:MAG: chloride channel protein, partial [Brachymonas denitrificans]
AGVLGLIIAILGLATNGQTFGGGAESVRDLLAQEHEPSPLFVPFKFLATWLTAWSGVPGGIFAPSLAVGAGVGYDVAQYSDNMPLMAPLVAMGMAAFLAAVTQAPLTAFIIVMEMVDGGAMVLSLMAAAMVASMVSRSISRPLYPALAGAMYAALQPQAPSTPAGEDKKPTTDPAPELAAAVAAAHQDSEPAEAETGAEAPLRTTLETAGDDPRHPASPEPPAADDQQPPADPPVKGSHSQPDLFP